jgi:aspartyl-tRNA(Asn)/glutamyl-tRNA(Gln) amidotransferase subunit A
MLRIPDWSALDGAARRRRRQAARPQARALDPVLNAFVQISLAPAQPPAAGMDGLPYAAKDMLQTPWHRPSCGLSDGRFPQIAGNCDLLDRVAAAGGDLIGFANMTELAYEPSGFNASRGRVRNPWNLDCISGGSSSGSAAAVASGTVVAALGSDTGGSLRIPAQACGVTAWMPTHGLVSAHGTMPLAPTLDTVGLLARSAEDMTLLIPVMARPPRPGSIDRATVAQDVVAECDPAIRRATALAIDAIAAAGVAIEHRPALAAVEAIDRHALIVLQAESSRVHRVWIDDLSVAPVLRHRLAKGLTISEEALAGSIARRAVLAADFEDQVLAANDAVILPVMPIPTPGAAECDPTSEHFSARTLYALSRFTRFVNMLGFPAVALPAGFDHRSMPVGLQIVGRAGSDLALLDLVRHVQSKTDWHGRVPAAIADLLPRAELAS